MQRPLSTLVSPTILAFIGLALTNLFWAGNAVVARFSIDGIPPFTLSFLRWILAFILLLPFAWPHLKGQWQEIRRHGSTIIVLGVLGVSIYNTSLYLAAHSTTAINITLVSSNLPLITLLMSGLMLRLTPTRWQFLGIFSSLIGVFFIVSQGDIQSLRTLQFNRGDIMILCGSCCWSLYSVILRKYPIALHPIGLITVLIGAGLPLLFLLLVIEWMTLPTVTLTMQTIPIFLYVAIFPSILAFLFWGYGVKILGPNITAASCYLMPLFAALLAIPLLGEQLYWYHFVGGTLIFIGLYFGSLFKTAK